MTGDADEDIRHFKARYERAPDSRLFAPLADAYRKSGDLDRAIALCEKGLERYPSYASAHVILGKCFYDKGATERARSEFLSVIELDQENMVALKFLGDILAAEGDRESAARYYRRLLAVDPTNEEVEAALGKLEEGVQVRQIDLTDEKQIRRIEGSSELATMTLAGIYASQGYYNKALKIYQDIIRNEPENEQARKMVEKLEAMMSASEGERRGTFDDEVLTISLDDVTEDVASSSAGTGGIESEGDAGTDDGAAEGRPRRGPLTGERKADEFAEVVRELDEADTEPGTGRSGERARERPAEEPADEMSETTQGELEDFRRWIRKLQSDKDTK
jgi:tetratricopeptide (TPR) repeat protein